MATSFDIRLERSDDNDPIESLHAIAFGPGRFARTAFRLREGVAHEPQLSFVAEQEGILIGSVRLTAITIDDCDALLLGPLTVHPNHKSNGAGKGLVARALRAAKSRHHGIVVLVGDAPYYGPLGFERVPVGQITLPGPVDPNRLLAAELETGSLARVNGLARKKR